MRLQGRIRIVIAAAWAGAVLISIPGVTAQTYPTKPIRMIVPWPPGGGTDIVARLVVQPMAESMGQQFVVDNRGGAAGIIGTELAARAVPDGYTLLLGNTATNVTNAVIYKKLNFDIIRDFTPLSLVASSSYILSVTPSLPVKSVQELIALAKAKPGYLNYGTGGMGSNPHFAAALFNYMAGTQMTHVPYKGGALHTPGVVAGEVHLNMTGPLEVLSYIKAGRLRALGVTSTKRWASMPELPTISESGVPGYEFSAWYGVLGPAGIPKPVVSRLHTEIVKALRTPEVRKTFDAQSIDIIGSSPEQFAEQIKSEFAKWQKVAAQAGIKAE